MKIVGMDLRRLHSHRLEMVESQKMDKAGHHLASSLFSRVEKKHLKSKNKKRYAGSFTE